MKKRTFLFLWVCACFLLQGHATPDKMDLAGLWRFQLDPLGFGKTPGSELYLDKLVETIMLPGSTDEAGKGIKNNVRYVDRLSRKYEYQGMAWYQREVVIPDTWENKEIFLNLERCHWETTVYVDGRWAGTDERLSVGNSFRLTEFLSPGVHTITLCVDNRLKYPMDQWNHGTTEYTQTNWNGIVGELSLVAKVPTHIEKVNVYPDIGKNQIKVDVKMSGLKAEQQGTLKWFVREKLGELVASEEISFDFLSAANGINQEISMGKQMKLWDEFSPFLYELETRLTVDGKEDVQVVAFGMREVEQGKHHIRLNNRNIHLRGVLDCAVFPLTGYPSTDVGVWKRIFSTIKEYGMNHVRFHSWCPPEAAFIAGDELGMYLQVELPMWIKDAGKYPARRDFFEKEMFAILDTYGNHPSFLLMCNGNENEGDFAVLEDLVKKGQAYDDRHLYSASTARTHVASDQYYVSHVTEKGWITVYEGSPSTNWDRSKESDIDVPVIAHETGQRCMYPDFKEIKKYKGVLEARNFEVFRERLAKNGILHQAEDFFQATGKHTVLQYKEVNESLLRTANSGGFQLLGLADFPGQGSAFVGILDAFWESKGLVTPEKFRESCGPSVLLARIPKRIYSPEESLTAQIEIYHYGKEPIKGERLKWTLIDETGKVLQHGNLKRKDISVSTVDSLGIIRVSFSSIMEPCRLTLKAKLGEVQNEWDIWVYPQLKGNPKGNVIYARSWNKEVKKALADGKNVLLIPDKLSGRKTKFASHFWNPIMFNWDPMIVGTWIDSKHPVFKDFPTNAFADWQWWDILNYASALELDGFKGLTPVIQSIDSYESNQKLGIAFETKVGKGNLFVLNLNVIKDIDKRPASQQLLYSVYQYVSSEQFKPTMILQPHELDGLFLVEESIQSKKSNNKALLQLLNK